MTNKIVVESIGIDRSSQVQNIFEGSQQYFLNTTRSRVQPNYAIKEMTDSPPLEKQAPTYRKFFCLISLDGLAIGVADLHKDHPKAAICYIGLLLINETHQKQGIGRAVYAELEQFIKTELNCSTIRLGVSQDNDVEGFWLKVGFERNGHSYIFESEGHQNQVIEMEKAT
jgi:GNAT superfamily N-acetyltransferase